MFNDDDNWGNNFGGSNGGRVSERENLELDEFGNNKEAKRRADMEQNGGYNNGYGNNYGGYGDSGKKKLFSNPFNKNTNNNRYNDSQGSSSGGSYIVVIAIIVGVLVIGAGGWYAFTRTMDRTADENLNSMFNSITTMNKQKNKLTKQELEGKEKGLDAVYDYKNIFDGNALDKQVDKEYLVFAYTGNEETDKKFYNFVKANDKKIPIYRINITELGTEGDAINFFRGNDTPMFLLYNEPEKNYKVLDKVYYEDADFDKIIPYIQGLMKGKMVEDDDSKTKTKDSAKDVSSEDDLVKTETEDSVKADDDLVETNIEDDSDDLVKTEVN